MTAIHPTVWKEFCGPPMNKAQEVAQRMGDFEKVYCIKDGNVRSGIAQICNEHFGNVSGRILVSSRILVFLQDPRVASYIANEVYGIGRSKEEEGYRRDIENELKAEFQGELEFTSRSGHWVSGVGHPGILAITYNSEGVPKPRSDFTGFVGEGYLRIKP